MHIDIEIQKIGMGNAQWVVIGRYQSRDLAFEATVDSLAEAAEFVHAFVQLGR